MSDHDAQPVVEIIGNTACQSAHGLHLLGLSQSLLQDFAIFFGLLAFIDVPKNKHYTQDSTLLILDWRSAVVNGHLFSVTADQYGVVGQSDG